MQKIAQKQYTTHMNDDVWVIEEGGRQLCCAVPLERSNPVFQYIEAQFQQYGPNVFEVVRVWRVHNESSKARYEKRRLAMALRAEADSFSDSYPREVEHLFHTTRAPLSVVLAEGLNVQKSRVGLFGKGVYATDSVIKASSYWPLNFNRRVMLDVSMLVGTPFEAAAGQAHSHLLAPPSGYDSVVGNLRGFRETVVYNSAQVHIHHVIDYAVLPDYGDVANRILFGR